MYTTVDGILVVFLCGAERERAGDVALHIAHCCEGLRSWVAVALKQSPPQWKGKRDLT